jgi:hypothetical protein
MAAEYEGLKEKRVAVVCRPVVSLEYRYSTVARELAKKVGDRLAENVPKVKVIDAQEVDQWDDGYSWEDYREIGRALKADMVVGIDLENFSLYQSQTLYQGRSNVRIHVYDLKDGGKQVFEKIPDPSIYPPNTGIPTSEKQESQFRLQYVNVLADEVARHFYDHDSRATFAIDSTAF